MLLCRSLVFVALGALSLLPRSAFADEVIVVEPDWSVGAGVQLRALSFSGVGIGGLAGLGTLLSYGVALEHRLGGPVWLRVQGNAGVQDGGVDGASSTGHHLSGGAGLRWAFVQLGEVELSGIGTMSLAWSGIESVIQGAPETLDTNALSVSGSAGLSAEYAFNEALSLRLASDLAAVTWTKSRLATFDGTAVSRADASAWAASLALDPSIELRLRF